MDKSGRTWYYALCVDFQLEAGITVLPYKKCEQYYQEEGKTMMNLRDPEAETSYFTSMWLWFLHSKFNENIRKKNKEHRIIIIRNSIFLPFLMEGP